jgi:hypothetical protein
MDLVIEKYMMTGVNQFLSLLYEIIREYIFNRFIFKEEARLIGQMVYIRLLPILLLLLFIFIQAYCFLVKSVS